MIEELSRLPGLGPSRVRALEKAGVRTLRDLVSRLPVAYRDLTAPTPLRLSLIHISGKAKAGT